MTQLDHEAYALVLARVARRGYSRLGEILSELGVAPEDFRRDEPVVLAELASAWPERKGKIAMKFATALAEELGRLGGLGVEAELPPPARASLGAPEKVLPSFLQAAPLAVPSQVPPPSASPAPPGLPPVIRAPAHLAGTAETDFTAILAGIQRGSLPFSPSASPVAASAPSEPPRPAGPAQPAGAPTVALPAMEVDLAQYPLELYAAVTGALARGEPRADVLAAHHLSSDSFEKIAHAWTARLAVEPQLLERFRDMARAGAVQARKPPRGDGP